MARFKDFGSGASTEGSKEPVVFKIYGEQFTCIPTLQGKTLLDLISDSGSDDPAKSSATTIKFFESVLTDESLEKFNALINSKDKIVSIETLTEITTWLIEEYTDRPLEQSEAL